MICRLRARAAASENGLTLVETLATIIIMGLVIGPLSMAMVQALNIIPQAGQRTQSATDYTRLQQYLADDTAQAWVWENVAYSPTLALPNSLWFPEWFGSRPTAPSTGYVDCPAAAPALNTSTTTKILVVFHKDLTSATGHQIVETWQIVITNTGLARMKVDVQRQEQDQTAGTTGPWDTMATAYCTLGTTRIAALTAVAPQASPPSNGSITLALAHLFDKNSNAVTDVSFTNGIRSTYR